MTSAFFCCAAMLFGAALCQFKLVDILKTTKHEKDNGSIDNGDIECQTADDNSDDNEGLNMEQEKMKLVK